MAIFTIECPRSPTENDDQVALFDWISTQRVSVGLQARVPLADYAWMNPNGLYLGTGKAKHAYIAKAKRAGFKSGVSDITLAIPRHGFHCMYLELKRAGMSSAAQLRAVSPDQRRFLCDMANAGYFAAVAFGFDDAKCLIEGYLRCGGARVPDARLDCWGTLEDGVFVPIEITRRRRTRKLKSA